MSLATNMPIVLVARLFSVFTRLFSAGCFIA
jgi:hypothetical protein